MKCFRVDCVLPKLYASSGPMAEGVSIKNQRGDVD